MADHIQQVFSNFETNQQLAQEAQNFGNFLNVRSQFDQQYLSQYDPLSLQADTGPSDLLKRVPNWVTGTSSIVEGYCGDAVFTAEQNVQKPYSQCAPCNSIYCAQQAASAQGCPIASQGSMAVLGPGGRSKYDLQYDSQYEKLSMGADTNFAGHGAQPNWVTGTRIITGGGTPQPRSPPPQPRPRSLPPQPRPTSREGYAPGSEKKGALKGMHPPCRPPLGEFEEYKNRSCTQFYKTVKIPPQQPCWDMCNADNPRCGAATYYHSGKHKGTCELSEPGEYGQYSCRSNPQYKNNDALLWELTCHGGG